MTFMKKMAIRLLAIAIACFVPMIISLVTNIEFELAYSYIYVTLCLVGLLMELRKIVKFSKKFEYLKEVWNLLEKIEDSQTMQEHEHPKEKLLRLLSRTQGILGENLFVFLMMFSMILLARIPMSWALTIACLALTIMPEYKELFASKEQ